MVAVLTIAQVDVTTMSSHHQVLSISKCQCSVFGASGLWNIRYTTIPHEYHRGRDGIKAIDNAASVPYLDWMLDLG
jgi:hypothetical protein